MIVLVFKLKNVIGAISDFYLDEGKFTNYLFRYFNVRKTGENIPIGL